MHATPESNKVVVQSFEIILENKVLQYKQEIIIASEVCEEYKYMSYTKGLWISCFNFCKVILNNATFCDWVGLELELDFHRCDEN